MTLTTLMPELRELQRADKLRVIQFLVSELANEEGVSLLEAGAAYSIWTPYNAFEAADTLMNALLREPMENYG